MSMERRKRVIRIVERTALGIMLLDALLYFVVIQPTRSMTQQTFERSNQVRLRVLNEETQLKRLEWYKESVPMTEKEVESFLSDQVQSKRKSFTRATRLVRDLADQSGLDFSGGISYRMDAARDEPLDRMNITVLVKGPFNSLMNFAHGLETTSDDFFVIHDFSFDYAEGGKLALKLSADLYLTP
jgi:hypothetical protein